MSRKHVAWAPLVGTVNKNTLFGALSNDSQHTSTEARFFLLVAQMSSSGDFRADDRHKTDCFTP